MHTEQLYPAVCFCTDAVKRESPYNRSTAFRVGESISVKLCPGIHLSPKVNWNRISFWKYFKIKFFGRKKSKNSAHCRVHHLKVLHFQRFFHFLGSNWSLHDVKETILVLQKQLISTKTVLIYTHFAVGGKGAQNAYFQLSTVQNPHIF